MTDHAIEGQLFVRYTHVNPAGLPRELHVNSPMIPIEAVDAKAHAQAAPAAAEWFEYFHQPRADAPYSPLEDTPVYFLDTRPEDRFPKYGIQGVALRHSGMQMPFYPAQPRRNAVITSQ